MSGTRIFWSGLTGKTGRGAMEAAREMPNIDIVMGLTRRDIGGVSGVGAPFGLADVDGQKFSGVEWANYDADLFGAHGLLEMVRRMGVNVIVDFSHPKAFDKVLELAVRAGLPLVSGTGMLSGAQMATLKDAARRKIPVFRDDVFCFAEKKFADAVVEMVRNADDGEDLMLCERLGMSERPLGEQTQALVRRIFKETGKTIGISSRPLDGSRCACDWRIGHLQYSSMGVGDLSRDVLKIAEIMTTRYRGVLYNLTRIWSELSF